MLLAEPIRVAIANGDSAGLKALAAIPGFGEQFDYATDNLPDPPNGGTPFGVLANAVFLLDEVQAKSSEWTAKAWRNLLSGYSVLVDGVTPAAETLRTVQRTLHPSVADIWRLRLHAELAGRSRLRQHWGPGSRRNTNTPCKVDRCFASRKWSIGRSATSQNPPRRN